MRIYAVKLPSPVSLQLIDTFRPESHRALKLLLSTSTLLHELQTHLPKIFSEDLVRSLLLQQTDLAPLGSSSRVYELRFECCNPIARGVELC